MKFGIFETSLFAVFAVCLTASAAFGDVNAQVKLAGGSSVLNGTLRWKPVSKAYVFATKGKSGVVERELKPSDIETFRVQKPANWDDTVKMIRTNPGAAATRFEKISSEYTMLQYDAEGACYAGMIYLDQGKPDAALRICEKVVSMNPEAASTSNMAPVYWRALVATGKMSNLEGYIDNAISSGSREAAAQALIIRGDMLKKKGLLKEALTGGYLRAVLMYRNAERSQPEALAKTAATLEELNQVTYAQRWKQELLSKYGNSKEAKALRGK